MILNYFLQFVFLTLLFLKKYGARQRLATADTHNNQQAHKIKWEVHNELKCRFCPRRQNQGFSPSKDLACAHRKLHQTAQRTTRTVLKVLNKFDL